MPLFTLRGAYTRSLGGVSEDESYRLEQTQVAGFPQTFRSLISESIVGSVCAPEYETYAAALDFKFPSRTYVGIQAQQLNSRREPHGWLPGLEQWPAPICPLLDSGTAPTTARARSAAASTSFSATSLVVGAGYTYNQAKLQDTYPKVPLKGFNTTQQADLQEASGYILFNHPSGFFARADATWYHQENSGYTPALPGDDFVQENIYLGYRFLHRHAEVMFGILNLSDQDYHLNPLNTYLELPRERTFILRVNFIF